MSGESSGSKPFRSGGSPFAVILVAIIVIARFSRLLRME